jgi:hypothetical protein
MAKAPRKESEVIAEVVEIEMEELILHVVGKTPLVPHAVSFKAMGSLLFPSPPKNAAERATTMKHEPFEEFRDAAYQFRDEDEQPTRLYVPGSMFHAAVSAVALDMKGAKKAQIGRLTSVNEHKIPLWGVPEIWTTVVRSSDIARTPDVRTLPILPRWCAMFSIRYVKSLIKRQSIMNLLAAAGVIVGIGDGRPQNGKLAFGQFAIVPDNDPEFKAIVALGGRKMQDAALADPKYFDIETERLLRWFIEEKDRRAAAPAQERKRKANGDDLPTPEPHVIEQPRARARGRGRRMTARG